MAKNVATGGVGPPLHAFVASNLADATATSRNLLTEAVRAAVRPQEVAKVVEGMQARAAALQSTHENVAKMPELLAKLEAALDESLACAQVVQEIAKSGHRPGR